MEIKKTDNFGLRGPRNQRRHHQDVLLYKGSIEIPIGALELAQQATPVKSTHGHSVIRIEHDGIVYVFRRKVAPCMIGEVVSTTTGAIRVHVWSACAIGYAIDVILGRASTSCSIAPPVAAPPSCAPNVIEESYPVYDENGTRLG